MSAKASGNLWTQLSAASFGGAASLIIMVFVFAVARVVPFHVGLGLGVLALLLLGFGGYARRKSRE